MQPPKFRKTNIKILCTKNPKLNRKGISQKKPTKLPTKPNQTIRQDLSIDAIQNFHISIKTPELRLSRPLCNSQKLHRKPKICNKKTRFLIPKIQLQHNSKKNAQQTLTRKKSNKKTKKEILECRQKKTDSFGR
jgi:hypothetical protein